MNKFSNSKKALSKMILIVAVVVIVIAVAAGAAAIYLSQNPSTPNTNPTATPPASTNPDESSTPAPTTSTGNVATATSLKFSVSLTENGAVKGIYTFQGKNTDSSSPMIRIDFTEGEDNTIFIFNGAQDKAWTYSGNEWVDISAYYDQQYQVWDNLWKGYVSSLAAWTGAGDHSYTQDGQTVRIYDIQVNPVLADSLFEHT
jgi:hypothetical protein